MRKVFIAGNWKMNKTLAETKELIAGLNDRIGQISDVDIAVAPTYVNLESAKTALAGSSIKLAAQNCHHLDSGAYTAEISLPMLQEIGCDYVIIGHSERRQYFGETDLGVNEKVRAALAKNVTPIMCIGETLEERESEKTFQVVETQLVNGLKDLTEEIVKQGKEIVIAYEPVWAIGTGKVATPDQAQEVHAFIRKKLTDIFNADVAQGVRIQYGGSVKPDNVEELIKKEDIDGALVGGASLKVDSFSQLIERCVPAKV